MGRLYTLEHHSPSLHDLPVAADLDLTPSLRCRITVANRFPAYFSSDVPRPTRRLRRGRLWHTLRIDHTHAILITILLGQDSLVHISIVGKNLQQQTQLRCPAATGHAPGFPRMLRLFVSLKHKHFKPLIFQMPLTRMKRVFCLHPTLRLAPLPQGGSR